MKDEDVIRAVREINADIYEKTQSEYIHMEYRSDGTANSVMFLGQCLWDDDDDMRKWLDDGYNQETLLDCLKREGQAEIEKLFCLRDDWQE